jgi:hypothetical protein
MQAFTIGSTKSYDRALAEAAKTGKPVMKLGKGSDPDDPGYEGGWVFQLEAEAVLEYIGQDRADYSVYELDLPGSWEDCTYKGIDGLHHLTVDARIVGRGSL